MAERRMFAKTIIDSDAFLDMPASTQALYFHLCMRADDDGFINNPKRVQRMVGSSDDDFKLLLAKNFILLFESGVIVIKHWKIHNYIQSDRYKPTNYEDEKAQLEVKKNKAYTWKSDECIQNGYMLDTQVSIGKDRLDKVSLGKSSVVVEAPQPTTSDYDGIIKLWNSCQCTQKIDRIAPMTRRENNTRLILHEYSLNDFLNAIKSIDEQEYFQMQAKQRSLVGYDWFVDINNFQKVIEGNYRYEHREESFLERLEKM